MEEFLVLMLWRRHKVVSWTAVTQRDMLPIVNGMNGQILVHVTNVVGRKSDPATSKQCHFMVERLVPSMLRRRLKHATDCATLLSTVSGVSGPLAIARLAVDLGSPSVQGFWSTPTRILKGCLKSPMPPLQRDSTASKMCL